MGWKIVRDNHQKILGERISGCWRASLDPVSSLVKKLGEEYSELAENRDPAELYDIWDVLNELAELLDPDAEAARKHEVKRERMGGFSEHLEWHPNPHIDLWTQWDKEH